MIFVEVRADVADEVNAVLNRHEHGRIQGFYCCYLVMKVFSTS